MLKVALVDPDVTVTDPGTPAFAELDERETAIPDAGAGALSVTVPVVATPPVTLDGEIVSPDRLYGVTVRVPVTCADA